MPTNKKMMKSLKKEYGDKKGEKVYYALEKMPASHSKMTPKQHKKAMAKSVTKKKK